MKVILTVLSLFMTGCGFLQKGSDKPIPYLTSPAGHRFLLYTDNGAVGQGLFSTDDLGRWVDARIAEWVLQRTPTHGSDRVHAVSRSHGYYLVDHFSITRGKQAVAGQYDDKRRLVIACIYGYSRVKEKPDESFRFERPVGDETSDWYHEVLRPGKEIPVIGHELDHALGIGHDK